MTRFTLDKVCKNTLEIKKSQFITWLIPLEDKQAVKESIQLAKQEYPDARHHCWAYIMGANPNSMTAAMSDDGEPSGTAGKPMLNVLQHKPVDNVLAIVIRYFGGVKLGAGGLVRAYSQAVEQCFALAELVPVIPKYTLTIKVPFADEQWLRHHTDKNNGEVLTTLYSDLVTVQVSIPQGNYNVLRASLESRNIDFNREDK
ncbi:YigZ family protein [Psychrosphaera sp. F3M07]|uniref:YigZ family protein n=1 Tax=Psychrosphaera sp. F3M07 TaxID=2841560 RepID=UPI001C098443|nr:YigZ family protein [Psychrosphaera sp. F3M07]MBU2916569.1 YigZ family protein [Psychrosphaera sp. F3M07]